MLPDGRKETQRDCCDLRQPAARERLTDSSEGFRPQRNVSLNSTDLQELRYVKFSSDFEDDLRR